jgi:hypothetical protein
MPPALFQLPCCSEKKASPAALMPMPEGERMPPEMGCHLPEGSMRKP